MKEVKKISTCHILVGWTNDEAEGKMKNYRRRIELAEWKWFSQIITNRLKLRAVNTSANPSLNSVGASISTIESQFIMTERLLATSSQWRRWNAHDSLSARLEKCFPLINPDSFDRTRDSSDVFTSISRKSNTASLLRVECTCLPDLRNPDR